MAVGLVVRTGRKGAKVKGLLATTAVALVLGAPFAHAQSVAKPVQLAQADQARGFTIPAGPLNDALTAFGAQAGMQVSVETAQVQGVTSPGASGRMTPQEALAHLLAGTGFTYRLTGNTATLEKLPPARGGAIQLGPVQVEAAGASKGGSSDPAATEGLHSYAANAATVAGKTAQRLREIPQSVSVITRQQLDDENAITIEDALRQATGITVQTSGNPYLGSAYYARGYALSSEYDGVPSSSSLNVGTPQFDLAMYDRIEVLRGAAGLTQGAGEPGGVVNFARKRPLDTFQTSGSVSVGSWNAFHADGDVTGPLNESGSVRGRLVLAGTDQDFYYDNSHARSGMVYGIVEADLTPTTLFSLSGTVQADAKHGVFQGLPTYTTGGFLDVPQSYNPDPSWTRIGQTSEEVFAELSQRLGDDWQIKGSLRYHNTTTSARYAATETGVNPIDNTADYFSTIDHTDFSWLAADVNATGSFDLLGRTHQLLIGVNYDESRHRDQYGGSYFPGVNVLAPNIADPNDVPTGDFRSPSEQYGAYGQLRLSLMDPLTLVLGGRLTHYDSQTGSGSYGGDVPRISNPGGTNAKFTPYAGLLYAVDSDISVYANYASIFVPQTELTQAGNALPSRVGNEYEVGAKGSFFDNGLNASVALFDLQDKNRAYNFPIGSFFYLATGKVETKGFEFELSGSPLPGWDIFAGYTYVDAQYDADATNQGQAYAANVTPRHNFKLWSVYRFSDGVLNGFSAGGGVLASSSLVGDQVRQSGYAVFSGQLGYKIDDHWQATVTVNNIADTRYYQTVNWTGSGNYFGDPRNVMFTLRTTY